MYLLVTQDPIHLEGPRPWLPADRRRALVLLREALEDRLGPVTVLAPWVAFDGDAVASLDLEEVQPEDGLRLLPSIELRGSYWLQSRARWQADLRAWVSRAHVVHAGLADLWRPLDFDAFREGRRQEKATVFVLACDAVARAEDAARAAGAVRRVGASLFGAVYEGAARYGARTADLTLLRAGQLLRRYGPHARNARAFEDTSFRARDVVSTTLLEDRLRARVPGQPLRVVAFGPLEPSQGFDHAIDTVRLARQRGTAITIDILGDGPERQRLAERIASLGVRAAIRLAGPPPRSTELLRRLAGYDAQLVTPVSDEAPRTVFDGLAAGLPVVGYAVEHVRQRVEEDGAAVAVRIGDVDSAARTLEELGRDAERLTVLTRAARRAGLHHAADAWHRRRAAWTLEAVRAAQTAAQAGRQPAATRRGAA